MIIASLEFLFSFDGLINYEFLSEWNSSNKSPIVTKDNFNNDLLTLNDLESVIKLKFRFRRFMIFTHTHPSMLVYAKRK